MEKLNQEQFIVIESWRKTRDRILAQYPNTKVKYSYKTKQFTIYYDLPSDIKYIKSVKIVYN